MNTGDEGRRGTLILLSSACTIHNTCVRAGAVPVWVGDNSRVSSKLALIISMSALVSFSELLLALVSSIPCIPSPGLAGGEGDGMCVLRKCQITKKQSHTHTSRQPGPRTENWKYIRQLWHRVNNLPSPPRHGHTGLQSGGRMSANSYLW